MSSHKKISDEEEPNNFSPLVRMVVDIVKQVSGIRLGEKQNSMIQSRLVRRMLDLDIDSPHDYLNYLNLNRHSESLILVSLLTTHHTYFFREFEQLHFVQQNLLTDIVRKIEISGRKVLRVWSMACSRGQEVYSLSMFLYRHLNMISPGMKYEILGTDIDPESLAIAKNGVYRWEEIKTVPAVYLENHWQRGSGEISDFVKAKPSIKAVCRFELKNLLEMSSSSSLLGSYDLIFCRNVFIYFTDQQIDATVRVVLNYLSPWGVLCLGISESLNGRKLPVNYLAYSIYSKKELPSSSSLALQEMATPNHSLYSQPDRYLAAKTLSNIRVLCVDDSPTVLTILKSILSPSHGFEIVATAKNGLEAKELAKNLQFDAMTLDIHMPVQDGIAYLLANYSSSHPPIVVVSSVSREEASLGLKALELGASDYVEKPSLADLSDRGEELRNKLRCAVFSQARQLSTKDNSVYKLSQTFKRAALFNTTIRKLRIFALGLASMQKVVSLLKLLSGLQPATILLFDCAEKMLAELTLKLSLETAKKIEIIPKSLADVEPSKIYIATIKDKYNEMLTHFNYYRTSMMIFPEISGEDFNSMTSWPGAQILLEEASFYVSEAARVWQANGGRCIPITSILFDSDEYLRIDV